MKKLIKIIVNSLTEVALLLIIWLASSYLIGIFRHYRKDIFLGITLELYFLLYFLMAVLKNAFFIIRNIGTMKTLSLGINVGVVLLLALIFANSFKYHPLRMTLVTLSGLLSSLVAPYIYRWFEKKVSRTMTP